MALRSYKRFQSSETIRYTLSFIWGKYSTKLSKQSNMKKSKILTSRERFELKVVCEIHPNPREIDKIGYSQYKTTAIKRTIDVKPFIENAVICNRR